METNNLPSEPYKFEEDLKEAMYTFISKASPLQRQAILAKIGGKPTLNTTYYNRKYGLMLRDHLMMMFKERKVLYFPYTDYPKWSHKTVYQYVQNGFKFAVDFLDDEEHNLKHLKEDTEIKRNTDGVRIIFKEDDSVHILKPVALDRDDPLARPQQEEMDTIQDAAPNKDEVEISWRQKLMTWMEEAKTGAEFNEPSIKLTDEDMNYLNNLYESDPVFGHIINEQARTFKVRRIG